MRDPNELKGIITGLHTMAADLPDDARMGVVIVMRHIPKGETGITRFAFDTKISSPTAVMMLASALNAATGLDVEAFIAAQVTPEDILYRAELAMSVRTFQ